MGIIFALGLAQCQASVRAPIPCNLRDDPTVSQHDCRETLAAEQSANLAQWSLLVAMGAAIVAIAQIVALVATINQTRDSVAAGQRSAKAAEDAVAKSDEILKHTKDSDQRIERAYVYAVPASDNIKKVIEATIANELAIDGDPEAQKEDITIKVQFKNYGKTPARLKHGELYAQFSGISSEPGSVWTIRMQFHFPLGADEQTDEIDFPIPSDQIDINAAYRLSDGDAGFSLNGNITYSDIWQREHTCWVLFRYRHANGCLVPEDTHIADD